MNEENEVSRMFSLFQNSWNCSALKTSLQKNELIRFSLFSNRIFSQRLHCANLVNPIKLKAFKMQLKMPIKKSLYWKQYEHGVEQKLQTVEREEMNGRQCNLEMYFSVIFCKQQQTTS